MIHATETHHKHPRAFFIALSSMFPMCIIQCYARLPGWCISNGVLFLTLAQQDGSQSVRSSSEQTSTDFGAVIQQSLYHPLPIHAISSTESWAPALICLTQLNMMSSSLALQTSTDL